jgi:hypothetical protein
MVKALNHGEPLDGEYAERTVRYGRRQTRTIFALAVGLTLCELLLVVLSIGRFNLRIALTGALPMWIVAIGSWARIHRSLRATRSLSSR